MLSCSQTLLKTSQRSAPAASASRRVQSLEFSRGKRTKGAASANTQRIVTQLSVLSASRKQPRLIKLCNEDLVRHQTVNNAWSLFQKMKRESLNKKLAEQYRQVENAMDDLQKTNKFLYAEGSKKELSKRFSLELRAPTDYPPNQIWNYKFSRKE